MKSKLLISILLFSAVILYPHSQTVHQYIVVEAYKILINQLNYNLPQLHNHIGKADSNYFGSSAWQKPFITTGAWREDEEDVVYGYKDFQYSTITIENALTTITHFWDADNGDLEDNFFLISTDLILPIFIGPYENSYEKLLKYVHGGWVIKLTDTLECTNKLNEHNLQIYSNEPSTNTEQGITLQYDDLTTFYKTSELYLIEDSSSSYTIFNKTTNSVIPASEVEAIIVEDNLRDIISFEILGRMCHLLADVSVPAHTHNDEHGILPDIYESWMGGPTKPYLYWNSENVSGFINPYNEDNDPLHYLFYTMQQQANHFASNGPGVFANGNDDILGNPQNMEVEYLTSLGLSSYGSPTTYLGPWNEANLENIRNKTFPYLLQATAGMLYWFAVETDILTNIEKLSSREIINEFQLYSNYPNPFNPSTTIKFKVPAESNVKIEIFNILGQKITSYNNYYRIAGTYEYRFNSDEQGTSLASGHYFYRISSDSFSETKKMLLLK